MQGDLEAKKLNEACTCLRCPLGAFRRRSTSGTELSQVSSRQARLNLICNNLGHTPSLLRLLQLFCYFAVNGPRAWFPINASDLTRLVDFAFFTRPLAFQPKQLISNKPNRQSCGTSLWRWVSADLHAVEVCRPSLHSDIIKLILMISRKIPRWPLRTCLGRERERSSCGPPTIPRERMKAIYHRYAAADHSNSAARPIFFLENPYER